MARKPRIHYPGALYHVMLRGNGGEDIFFEDGDRRHFLGLVEEGVVRYRHRIHAFCLMANHVHFAVQVGDVALSKITQNLSFRYTGWINKAPFIPTVPRTSAMRAVASRETRLLRVAKKARF